MAPRVLRKFSKTKQNLINLLPLLYDVKQLPVQATLLPATLAKLIGSAQAAQFELHS